MTKQIFEKQKSQKSKKTFWFFTFTSIMSTNGSKRSSKGADGNPQHPKSAISQSHKSKSANAAAHSKPTKTHPKPSANTAPHSKTATPTSLMPKPLANTEGHGQPKPTENITQNETLQSAATTQALIPPKIPIPSNAHSKPTETKESDDTVMTDKTKESDDKVMTDNNTNSRLLPSANLRDALSRYSLALKNGTNEAILFFKQEIDEGEQSTLVTLSDGQWAVVWHCVNAFFMEVSNQDPVHSLLRRNKWLVSRLKRACPVIKAWFDTYYEKSNWESHNVMGLSAESALGKLDCLHAFMEGEIKARVGMDDSASNTTLTAVMSPHSSHRSHVNSPIGSVAPMIAPMVATFVGLRTEQTLVAQRCQQAFSSQISDCETWPKYTGTWKESHKYFAHITNMQNYKQTLTLDADHAIAFMTKVRSEGVYTTSLGYHGPTKNL